VICRDEAFLGPVSRNPRKDEEAMMPGPRVLMEGILFGEQPRWHEGRLWFSDWGALETRCFVDRVADVDGLPPGCLSGRLG
jgi:hypothetical protein